MTASVTAQFLPPTLTKRIATSAAVHAAFNVSARLRSFQQSAKTFRQIFNLPVAGFSADAPTTIVSAEMDANPSIWAPTCNLTTSSLAKACVERGSELT